MKSHSDKEYETKVLNINSSQIIAKLHQLNAQESPEVLSRRYVFALESNNIEFIRLRDNGQSVTLTYKYKVRGNVKIGQTQEIEIEVSVFDRAAQILSKLKFKHIFYQENKVQKFVVNDIEFSISTWPLIPSFLEIESNSQEKVKEGLKLISLEGQDVGDKDIKIICQDQGLDIHAYPELKFTT